MARLAENRYGKSLVRLARVIRRPDRHEFSEWTVQILLQGEFESCFVEGDNSKILPTDTMRNTVYSLARNSTADCIERFAKELIEFLLARNPQVSFAEVSVEQKAWEPLHVSGKPHPAAFVQASAETQTTQVSRGQNGGLCVVAGLNHLVILKTADSAFEGYIRDSLTTLPETADRLLGTSVRAVWTYEASELDFNATRRSIRELLLAAFANHHSKSVQHTLYAMAECVLEKCASVQDIHLVMPNKHFLLADLSRFGQDNPNQIFVPTDEPHGFIEARVCR